MAKFILELNETLTEQEPCESCGKMINIGERAIIKDGGIEQIETDNKQYVQFYIHYYHPQCYYNKK